MGNGETPNIIEYRDSSSSNSGASYDNLAREQEKIASQKYEGPSHIAESRISDAKWAELGGRPRNPTPEVETPTPTASTQPLEVGNTTDTTPQNTEGTLETPGKESATTEAPIVGEIPTPGAAPEEVKKFMEENPTQANGVDPDEFAESFFPRDGTAVDPEEYGLQSDYLYSATGDFSIKKPKENASLKNTLLQEGAGKGYTSLYDWYDQKPSQFTQEQIGQESPVVGMPDYRQKIDANGTVSVYKAGQEETSEYSFEKGFKSEG